MRQPRKLAIHERVDLVGQKFGKLTVKKFAGKNTEEGYLYIADCSCGVRNVLVPANRLEMGLCGWCRRPAAKPLPKQDSG